MYNIESLAELSGLTRRTVRYYIQLGLLPPPIGNCRGSYYTEDHLQRLDQIKRLSGQGVPLAQMKVMISPETCKLDFADSVEIVRWEKACMSNGIELSFKPDLLNKQELNKIKNFICELLEYRDNN